MMKMITQFVKQFAGNGNRPGGEVRSGSEAGSSGGDHPFRETFASALGKNVNKATAPGTSEEGQNSSSVKTSGTAGKEDGQSGRASGSEGKAKEAQSSGSSEASGKAGETKDASSAKAPTPAADARGSSKEGAAAKEGSSSNGTAKEHSATEGSSKETTNSEKIHSEKGTLPYSGEGAVNDARIAGQEAGSRGSAEQKAGDAAKASGNTQKSGKETRQSGGTSDKGAKTATGTAPTSTVDASGDAGKAPAVEGASGTSNSSKTQSGTVLAQPADAQKGQTAESGGGEKTSRTSKPSPSPQPAPQGRTNGAGGVASAAPKGEVQTHVDQSKVVSNGSTQTAEGTGAGQASSGRAPSQAAQNNAAAAGSTPARSSSSLLNSTTAGGGTAAPSGNNGAGSSSTPASSTGGNAGPAAASSNGANGSATGGNASGQTSSADGNAGSALATSSGTTGSSAGSAASTPAASGQSKVFDPSASGGSTKPGKIPQPSQGKGEGRATPGSSVSSGGRESTGQAEASGTPGAASAEGGGSSAAGVGRSEGSSPGNTGNGIDRPAQGSTAAPGSGTVAGEESERSRPRTILNGGKESSAGASSARGTGGGATVRSDTQAAAAYQTLNQTEARTQKEFSPGMGTAASTVGSSSEKMMDLNMGGGQDFTDGEGQNRGEMSRMEALNTSLLQSNSTSRQKLSVHIARAVRQEMQSGGKPDSQWRHHRFVLDDGQSVNVSFRQADGAIQMQLGTGNTELNRLLQQHVDQIRQHLRQELDVDVDLEFQHFGDGESRGEEAPESRSATSGRTGPGEGRASESPVSDGIGASRGTRYLGFNTNEWTA